jgi:hypothetical protein
MKIYHYVTGILNPTKNEVLGEEPEEVTDDEETDDETDGETDEETENINYKRREVTFVFEINSDKFINDIKAHDWEKMKDRNDIMRAMGVTTYDFITQTNMSSGMLTEMTSYISEDDYEDVFPLYVLFMPKDQGIKVDCDIEKEFSNVSTEEKIGTMCANKYDTFTFIEGGFKYGYTTPNCSAGNYECSYHGGYYNKKTACKECINL